MTNAERNEFIEMNQETWLHIGYGYKQQRQKMNLSAREVAGHLGVSETTIRNFENGKPVTKANMINKAYRNLLVLYKHNLQNELYKL